MNKLFLAAITIAFATVTAMAAEVPQDNRSEAKMPAISYWLHPKLGMVKVERATGLMVIAGRQQQPQAKPQPDAQQPKPLHDHSRMHKLM